MVSEDKQPKKYINSALSIQQLIEGSVGQHLCGEMLVLEPIEDCEHHPTQVGLGAGLGNYGLQLRPGIERVAGFFVCLQK